MASFHEVQFPPEISYGSRGGPGFSTDVTKLRSRAEQRVARFAYPMHAYDVSEAVKSYVQLRAIRDFFIARLGPAHGFRFKDWMDYSTDPLAGPDRVSAPLFTDVVIEVADGLKTTFQLVKKYTSGSITRARNIVKPVAGTVKSGFGGVAKTEGVHFSVNTTSGLITYFAPPTLGADVTCGCDFDVPVRFGEDLDEGLFVSIDDFSSGSVPSIPIVEDLQECLIADEYYYGGGKYFTYTGGITITLLDGRAIFLDPTADNLSVILPDNTLLPDGGPHFFLVNLTAHPVKVRDKDDVLVFTLPASSSCTVVLATIVGVKTWRAF